MYMYMHMQAAHVARAAWVWVRAVATALAILVRGNTMRAARWGWAILVVLVVLINVVGIPQHVRDLHGTCYPAGAPPSAHDADDPCDATHALFQLPDTVLRQGIPPYITSLYAYWVLTIELLFVAAFLIVAMGIVRRAPNDRMTLFVSVTFLTFSTITGLTQPLKIGELHGGVYDLAKPAALVVEAIATTCCLIFFYVFPSGTYVPRWTRSFAFVWCAINGLWLLDALGVPFNRLGMLSTLLTLLLSVNFLSATDFMRNPPLSLVWVAFWFGSGVVAQVSRWRRADEAQRRRMRWVLVGLCTAVLGGLIFYFPPISPAPGYPGIFPDYSYSCTGDNIHQCLFPVTQHPGLVAAYKMLSLAVAGTLVLLGPFTLATTLQRYPLRRAALIVGQTYVMLAGALLWVLMAGVLRLPSFVPGAPANMPEFTIAFLPVILLGFLLATSVCYLVLVWPFVSPSVAAVRRADRELMEAQRGRISEIAELLFADPDPQRMIRILAAQATQLVQSTHSIVYLRDPERDDADGCFRFTAADNPATTAPSLLEYGAEDVLKLKNEELLAPSQDWRLSVIVPLMGLRGSPGGALVGVLALGPKRQQARWLRWMHVTGLRRWLSASWYIWWSTQYTQYDQNRLRQLAREGGQAISTAHLRAAHLEMEQHRAEPRGQAEALAHDLFAAPSQILPTLHRLAENACESAEARAVLYNLGPTLADKHADPALVALAEGFFAISRQESAERLADEVHNLTDQLARDATGEWHGSARAHAWYQLCEQALRARSPADVAHLRPLLEAYDASLAEPSAGAAPVATAPVATASDASAPGCDDGAESDGAESDGLMLQGRAQGAERDAAQRWMCYRPAVVALRSIATRLSAAGADQPFEDQQIALEEALKQLTHLEREVTPACPPLERLLLQRIGARWRAAGREALEELHGYVEATLLTSHVFATPQARLALQLTNRGRRPVSNIVVELAPQTDYMVVEAPDPVKTLVPGWPVQVNFEVEPQLAPTEQRFRPHFRIRYVDEGKERYVSPAESTVEIMSVPTAPPQANPYVPGHVLEATSEVFFGRDELLDVLEDELKHGHSIVVTGQWRMGKSSLLKRLQARFDHVCHAVYFDGGRVVGGDAANFFADLSAQITETLALSAPSAEDFAASPATVFARDVLPAVFAALGDRQLLLLIDEFEELHRLMERGKLDRAVFSYLRHLMQHEDRVRFVFAGKRRVEEGDGAEWSAFFNPALHSRVGLLKEDAARDLIKKPVAGHLAYDDLALMTLWSFTAGHPYFLQLLCYALVPRAREERRTFVQASHVWAALPLAIEKGAIPLAAIWQAELSRDERVVLYALSHLMQAPDETATVTTVIAYWAARGVTLEEMAVRAAAVRLCECEICTALDLVDMDPTRGDAPHEPVYGWKVWIIGHWVRQTCSLSDVLGVTARRS
jgi:hypothetical protein